MNNIPVTFFDKCLIRVPFFPYNYLKYVDNVDYILSLAVFKEALYIASPVLYEEVYEKNERSEKVQLSIIKYFIRACTRCTPYGVFAGCNLGNIDEKSDVAVAPETDYKTYMRVDMDYLCALIRMLDKDPNMRNKLTYHLNTSLYVLKNRIRYIEYQMRGNKRKYTFSELKRSSYLDLIIESLQPQPLTIEELACKITSPDITLDEAKGFINNLIDEQILVSDLEPSVAGEDLIYQMQHKFLELGYSNPLIEKIIVLIQQCNVLPIGTRIENYKTVNKWLSEMYDFSNKNSFHLDCKIPMPKATIGKNITNAVLKGIYVLNRLMFFKENELLTSFKKSFYNRYDEQQIPLAIALDPQIGIGFGKWNELQGDSNTLIDDLVFPNNTRQDTSILMDNVQQQLLIKYEDFLTKDLDCLTLTEEDLDKIAPVNYDMLPEQLYSIVKVLSIDNEKQEAIIFMDGAAGISAANLLSRFGYLDDNINDFINKITKQQNDFYSDKIVAEILHLPEDRIGNIQMHHINRKYGIPYLSNPDYAPACLEIISIDDIMVSVPNGNRIVLHSKKLNKEILPCLTTAHNYSRGLPIYAFLSNLQHQNKKSLFFDWGMLFANKRFLPRLQFQNVILSPAKWTYTISDIPKQSNKSFDEYYLKIVDWKNENKIPDLVQIMEGDNKLLIDFKQKSMVKILLKQLKTKQIIVLEEFLFQQDSIHLVKRENDFFTNELIVCLYKN